MYSGQSLWKNNRQKKRYFPDFKSNLEQPTSSMAFYTKTILTDIGICVGMSNVNLSCENRRCYPPNIENISSIQNQSNTLICKSTLNFDRTNLHLYNGIHSASSGIQTARCCNYDIFNKIPNSNDFIIFNHKNCSTESIISTPSLSYTQQSEVPTKIAKKLPLQQSLPTSELTSYSKNQPHPDEQMPLLPPKLLHSSSIGSESFDYVKDTKLQYYKQYEMSRPLGHNDSSLGRQIILSSSNDLARIKAPKKKWIRHYFKGIWIFI